MSSCFIPTFEYFDKDGQILLPNVLRKIPKRLWSSLFTPEETAQIVAEQEQRLLGGMLARLATAMEHWQTLPGYPTTPTSRMENELARTQEQRIQRTAYFESLLRDQGLDADNWIAAIFGAFKSPLEFEGRMFDKLLDAGDEDSARDLLVEQVAFLAESYFVRLVIARAEHMLAGNEPVKGLIETLLYINDAYPRPLAPWPRALPRFDID